MGVIEEIHEDLEAEVDLDEFREAVEDRIEQMGGLADEESAAMLVAHELEESGGEVEGVAEIEAGMEEVKFVAEVTTIEELRTFDRDAEDEEEPDEGHVLNAEVADETGRVRIAFWNEHARDAAERLEAGETLRVAGRPKDGYRGVEVNVDKAEPAPDVDVDVQLDGASSVEDLSLGLSDVNLKGLVLDTESVRTFDRDDGSEGRVANLALGDPTGRVRATLWDGMADRAEELEPGTSVEVVDGYVRERDGDLELHVGERGAIEELDESVEYEPDSTPIEAVEIGQTVDLVGVVRSADPKRTFDRDDGSEGQVRNVRLQDDTDDIRIALWGDKADREIAPGDKVAVADVEIQDGWQDDLEASANWRSSITVLEDGAEPSAGGGSGGDSADDGSTGGTDLSSFGGDADDGAETGTGASAASDAGSTAATDSEAAADSAAGGAVAVESEGVEFTGTVVQAGEPVILDDGEETVSVETDADVHLGDEVTVRGTRVEEGRIDADDVF